MRKHWSISCNVYSMVMVPTACLTARDNIQQACGPTFNTNLGLPFAATLLQPRRDKFGLARRNDSRTLCNSHRPDPGHCVSTSSPSHRLAPFACRAPCTRIISPGIISSRSLPGSLDAWSCQTQRTLVAIPTVCKRPPERLRCRQQPSWRN